MILSVMKMSGFILELTNSSPEIDKLSPCINFSGIGDLQSPRLVHLVICQRCKSAPPSHSGLMLFSLQGPAFRDYDADCFLSEGVQSDQSLIV